MLEKMIITSFIALSSLSATAPVPGYIPEPVQVEETIIQEDETIKVRICDKTGLFGHNAGIEMVKKVQKHGSKYYEAESCVHHHDGEDRVWYQDYLHFYECPECGNKTGEYEASEEVGRDCFGF